MINSLVLITLMLFHLYVSSLRNTFSVHLELVTYSISYEFYCSSQASSQTLETVTPDSDEDSDLEKDFSDL